jgi:hypothetical protein
MRCPACPVPPDRDCRHDDVSPNACRLVVREAGRRDTPGRGFWTDRVLAASGLESRTLATESRVRVIREPPARNRPTARQSLDRLAIVKQCEHRSPQTNCGCGGLATCGLGKGRGGLVNVDECLSCVAEKGGAG